MWDQERYKAPTCDSGSEDDSKDDPVAQQSGPDQREVAQDKAND